MVTKLFIAIGVFLSDLLAYKFQWSVLQIGHLPQTLQFTKIIYIITNQCMCSDWSISYGLLCR